MTFNLANALGLVEVNENPALYMIVPRGVSPTVEPE